MFSNRWAWSAFTCLELRLEPDPYRLFLFILAALKLGIEPCSRSVGWIIATAMVYERNLGEGAGVNSSLFTHNFLLVLPKRVWIYPSLLLYDNFDSEVVLGPPFRILIKSTSTIICCWSWWCWIGSGTATVFDLVTAGGCCLWTCLEALLAEYGESLLGLGRILYLVVGMIVYEKWREEKEWQDACSSGSRVLIMPRPHSLIAPLNLNMLCLDTKLPWNWTGADWLIEPQLRASPLLSLRGYRPIIC